MLIKAIKKKFSVDEPIASTTNRRSWCVCSQKDLPESTLNLLELWLNLALLQNESHLSVETEWWICRLLFTKIKNSYFWILGGKAKKKDVKTREQILDVHFRNSNATEKIWSSENVEQIDCLL